MAEEKETYPCRTKVTLKKGWDNLKYLEGFEMEQSSEAIKGSLPRNQNTPKKCKFGLYAEQVSGTSFTRPRVVNRRVWQYKTLPSACYKSDFVERDAPKNWTDSYGKLKPNPNQIRYNPVPFPKKDAKVNFVEGLTSVCGAGSGAAQAGLNNQIYSCNHSMSTDNIAYCNSDGDYLILPQTGVLYITTEYGRMTVAPNELCVIQKGIIFQVDVEGPSRGYICEIFESRFQLPDLGIVGTSGNAHVRHFQTPTAYYEDIRNTKFTIIYKFSSAWFETTYTNSPFNTVAWFGNYTPYKYDMALFNAFNSVTFDHLDPSIFCVLSAQSATPGVAVCDFVIFPPRWNVQKNSFRPPYYHRNVMSEYMGLISGQYEAKPKGFVPGGGSIHNVFVGHGPDNNSFEKASNGSEEPQFLFTGSLAFMFESMYRYIDAKKVEVQKTYREDAWGDLTIKFNPNKKDAW